MNHISWAAPASGLSAMDLFGPRVTKSAHPRPTAQLCEQVTNSLTTWNRVPEFYRARGFIVVVTTARHLSRHSTKFHFTPPSLFILGSNLILSSHDP